MKSERTPTAGGGEAVDTELTLGEKIKKAGIAGTVAYIITELGFWAVSIPVIISSYHASTGEWLQFSDAEERAQILKLTAGFAGAARLAVPFRLSLALALTPKVSEVLQDNRLLESRDKGDAGN